MKPIINLAFDADDVMFETEKFIDENSKDFFKEKYNMNIVNPSGYNILEMFNCTEKQQVEFWTKNIIKYSLFFEPMLNLVEVLKKLKNDNRVNINIFIITSKYKALEPGIGKIVTFLFETGLKKHGIYDYIERIYYTSLDNSAEEKASICEKENISIMVEDNPLNILHIENKVNSINLICSNTRNNLQFDLGNVPRTNTYNEVYTEIMKIIDKILNEKSIFSKFIRKSKEEKQNMSTLELKDYYKEYKEYLENLPFNSEKMKKGEKFYYKIARLVDFYFKKYDPIVLNKEVIPKESGLIFASNHQCDKDFLLILSALKDIPWHPLLKKEFLDKFITKYLTMGVYSVYVDRDNLASRRDSTIELAKILLNSGNLIIFPEGTYTKSSKNLDKFKGKSPLYLSQSLDKYIVPISLTQNYTKKEKPIIRFNEPFKVTLNECIDEASIKLYNRIDRGIEDNKILKLTLKEINNY